MRIRIAPPPRFAGEEKNSPPHALDFIMTRTDNTRVIHPATGTELTAKSWLTEAPLRMLMNNLHPDVAERPEELVVYGGIGRAARDWESYDKIVETLRRLEDDETLLVQSGKPVGVFRTHADAPRVLIANSNLVPRWATWEHFNELDRKGLAMYGQMTAGSWIYIGAQGIVQGTYETFVEMGRQHHGGDLAGKWLLTAGLGGMGGAQPLAAVMAGPRAWPSSASPRGSRCACAPGYLDKATKAWTRPWPGSSSPVETGLRSRSALLGNAAELLPAHVRGRRPPRPADRSDHAPTTRSTATCQPAGPWTSGRPPSEREPQAVNRAACASMAVHVQAMLDFQAAGVPDRRLRQQHPPDGPGGRRGQRLRLPRLRARLHPPAVLSRGSGRSAGRRCRAIRRTSARPTPRSRS